MGFYYLDIIIAAAASAAWAVSATNAADNDPIVDILHQESESYNISGLVESDPPSEVEHLPFMYSKHVCDPAIATIMAWLVLVIGLEIHDFHYHLKLAHASATVVPTNDVQDDNDYGGVKIRRRLSNEFVSDEKYIASLEAVRLGLRDAIIDAIIVYSVMYAIIIGMTWSDVEPNFLLVIQGVGYIVSACILTSAGWKIPQWVRDSLCCLFAILSAHVSGANVSTKMPIANCTTSSFDNIIVICPIQYIAWIIYQEQVQHTQGYIGSRLPSRDGSRCRWHCFAVRI